MWQVNRPQRIKTAFKWNLTYKLKETDWRSPLRSNWVIPSYFHDSIWNQNPFRNSWVMGFIEGNDFAASLLSSQKTPQNPKHGERSTRYHGEKTSFRNQGTTTPLFFSLHNPLFLFSPSVVYRYIIDCLHLSFFCECSMYHWYVCSCTWKFRHPYFSLMRMIITLYLYPAHYWYEEKGWYLCIWLQNM